MITGCKGEVPVPSTNYNDVYWVAYRESSFIVAVLIIMFFITSLCFNTIMGFA